MKKKSLIVKILIFILTVAFVLPITACKNDEEEKIPSLPDYSSTNYQFEFESWLPSGNVKVNGVSMYIEEQDFYNAEDIKLFKDMGNTIVTLDTTLGETEEWTTSKTKKYGDLVYANGIEKVYIEDRAFWDFANSLPPYILDAESGGFENEAALDEFVTGRLEQYINEPWFYGVYLRDEPDVNMAENISTLVASIRRCGKALGKDVKVYVNLHPCTAIAGFPTHDENGKAYTTYNDRYRGYIEAFVKNSGTNNMSVDHYPFSNKGSRDGYFTSLQTLSNVCRDYKIEMEFYASTFSSNTSGGDEYRVLDQTEFYYNMNSIIGFGASTIHWYRYAPTTGYTYNMNGAEDGYYYDKGMLVDRWGNPTNIYYYAKDVIKEYQSFANVILNYDYVGASLYKNAKLSTVDVDSIFNDYEKSWTVDGKKITSTGKFESDKLTLVKNVETSKDATLLTELYDKKNELYMYMVMNPIDPYNNKYSDNCQTITVDFGADHEWVAEFDQGVINYVKLDNGKYTKTLSAGYATYVVPLNAKGAQTFAASDEGRDVFIDNWWK